jgi:hypothetical protein
LTFLQVGAVARTLHILQSLVRNKLGSETLVRFSALTAAALILIAASTARADAIYTWVNNAATTGSGTLTLSDEVYFAGGTSGELSLAISFPGADPRYWFNGTPDVVPMTIQTFINAGPIGLEISSTAAPQQHWHINFSLSVIGDGLDGSIRYEDVSSNMYMFGTGGGNWGNFTATSDLFWNQCRSNIEDECDQLGGSWLLTSAPSQSVPEPFCSGLLLLGLVGLGAKIRRFELAGRVFRSRVERSSRAVCNSFHLRRNALRVRACNLATK